MSAQAEDDYMVPLETGTASEDDAKASGEAKTNGDAPAKLKTKTKSNTKAKPNGDAAAAKTKSKDQDRKTKVKGKSGDGKAKSKSSDEKEKSKAKVNVATSTKLPPGPGVTNANGKGKTHKFKPGVSARRTALKLLKKQAEYLGQSEPFVRLVSNLVGKSHINEEKKAVRMTRGSVQALRSVYENDVEILASAAGDVCRMMGQTMLSVAHLKAAVYLAQRHRHMYSIASLVQLPTLRSTEELQAVLTSLGSSLNEVSRKTSRAMDNQARIASVIKRKLCEKTDEELRVLAGHLNANAPGSRRSWMLEAFNRLVYVGKTQQSSAIDLQAAKQALVAAKDKDSPVVEVSGPRLTTQA